ncbi:MAG TPA: YrhK family protein [Marivita sp.]|nr:YrhK family protein [Marivita sp.]
MLFKRDHRRGNDEQRRIYAVFEIIYTLVDFIAALCFIVGSVMFFFEEWQTPGTWLFLIGSICFALKPTLRLVRELKLAAMGDDTDLADRFKGD